MTNPKNSRAGLARDGTFGRPAVIGLCLLSRQPYRKVSAFRRAQQDGVAWAGYIKDLSCYSGYMAPPEWARNETLMWIQENRGMFSVDLAKLVSRE
jgi:hypothetical protein